MSIVGNVVHIFGHRNAPFIQSCAGRGVLLSDPPSQCLIWALQGTRSTPGVGGGKYEFNAMNNTRMNSSRPMMIQFGVTGDGFGIEAFGPAVSFRLSARSRICSSLSTTLCPLKLCILYAAAFKMHIFSANMRRVVVTGCPMRVVRQNDLVETQRGGCDGERVMSDISAFLFMVSLQWSACIANVTLPWEQRGLLLRVSFECVASCLKVACWKLNVLLHEMRSVSASPVLFCASHQPASQASEVGLIYDTSCPHVK